MLDTQKWFNLTIDELLETDENGYTKEERLLFDLGLEVVFFDDIKEMEDEREELMKYNKERVFNIKYIFETINERIAVVLV